MGLYENVTGGRRSCGRFLSMLCLALAFLPAAWAHQEAKLLTEFGGKGTGPGQFSEQTAFFADGSGNLFVSDATYRRVQRFDADGNVTLEITNSDLEGVRLVKPGAITADAAGNIYVVDRDFVRVQSETSRPVYYYAHAVRKFSASGDYIATFHYLPLDQKQPWPERAALAINADGDLSALIQYGDLDRTILLAVGPSGQLYVVDRDVIYELDKNGETVKYFGARGSRSGETYHAASASVDAAGNLYLADTENDRIVVYGPDGDFIRAFGARGTQDGELIRPFLVSAQNDGGILVGDEAVYSRVHMSQLPVRVDDPSPVLPQATLPIQYRLSPYRLYATRMKRVQAFAPDGDWLEKTLARFPVDSYENWHYTLRAIGGDGRLYFQHQQTLRVRVYVPTGGLAWGSVFKTLHVNYRIATLINEIDNPDLDAVLGTEADYRARGFLFRDKSLSFLVPTGTSDATGYGNLAFEYDWNERERFGLSGGVSLVRSRIEQFYQTEAGLDPERSFPQDDRDLITYDSADLQVRWERTLNQDPYRYRTMSTFLTVAVGRTSAITDAIAPINLRIQRNRQRFLDWEIGLEYDMSPRVYGTLSVLRGPAFGGYNYWWTYVDETGALFARGFREGHETRVQLRIQGYLE